MSENRSDTTIPGLLSDAFQQLADLVRTEVRLAKMELAENASRAGAASAFVAVGGVFLLAALFLFLQGIVALLVMAGMNPTLAIFVVALVTAIIGYLVMRKGMSDLSVAKMMPDRTVRSVEKDASMATEKVR